MASLLRIQDEAVARGTKLPELTARIGKSVGTALARMKLQSALNALIRYLPWWLAFLAGWALGERFGWVTGSLGLLLAGLLLVGLVGRSYWVSRRISGLEAALSVDRWFRFEGRFAAAYEFSTRNKEKLGGFQELAIVEAGRLYPFSASQASPLKLPRNTLWSLGTAALLAAVTLWPPELRATEEVRAPAVPPASEVALSGDDAELVREKANILAESVRSEDGKQIADKFNQLIIQLTDGSLTRSEGFREAAALKELLEERSREAEAVAQGIAKRGEILQRKAVTEGAGRAMSEHRLLDAQDALKKLAERLSSESQGLNQRELEDLRKSLEEVRKNEEASAEKESSSAEQSDRRSALEKKRDELAQKSRDGTASAEEKKQLTDTERELKKLDRQRKEQQQGATQQLSELDKKLAEAARALAEERKKAGGDFLKEAASQVAGAASKQLSDEEKQELLKQLEALKERLREQSKKGDQAERMRDFQRRARGGSPKPQEGQGQPGGKPGEGQGEITLAPGGAPIPNPGSEPGEGQGESSEQANASPGREPGHAHDENLEGDPSRLDGKSYDDKAAAGQDSGQGPSESETIASAAERGFVSGAYEKLYQQYRTVAEEVMEKDRIPPGRKTHIKRYFELIRPREEN